MERALLGRRHHIVICADFALPGRTSMFRRAAHPGCVRQVAPGRAIFVDHRHEAGAVPAWAVLATVWGEVDWSHAGEVIQLTTARGSTRRCARAVRASVLARAGLQFNTGPKLGQVTRPLLLPKLPVRSTRGRTHAREAGFNNGQITQPVRAWAHSRARGATRRMVKQTTQKPRGAAARAQRGMSSRVPGECWRWSYRSTTGPR